MRNTAYARVGICLTTLFGAAISSAEAATLTPQECAANHQVAIATANAQFQTAVRNCVASSAPGAVLVGCLKSAVGTHQSALSAELTTLRTCRSFDLI
jgi:hypothetical protein